MGRGRELCDVASEQHLQESIKEGVEPGGVAVYDPVQGQEHRYCRSSISDHNLPF